jgi:hypothetical protein
MTDKGLWFAVRLLFESNQSICEERIVLVRASDVDEAEQRAKKIAVSGEHEYANVAEEVVGWRFAEILDVIELLDKELIEGSEVYHHFLEPSEVDQIRRSLKRGSLR